MSEKKQPQPANQIDLQALTTFPHISSEYIDDSLASKFRKYNYDTKLVAVEGVDEKGNTITSYDEQIVLDDDGKPVVKLTEDDWAVMKIFTQDFRLGNLSVAEAYYVRWMIDLCSDMMVALPPEFSKPALLLLERAVSVSETSQGKSGFLRRMFNTFFQHSSVKEEQPQKRNFFGLGKKQQQGGMT